MTWILIFLNNSQFISNAHDRGLDKLFGTCFSKNQFEMFETGY